MNEATDAYRKLRAPAGAQAAAVNRYRSARAGAWPAWVPVAAFASAAMLAVLVAVPLWLPEDEASLSPVALTRLDLRQPNVDFSPSLASLSAPPLSELEVPKLNRIPNLSVEQETL